MKTAVLIDDNVSTLELLEESIQQNCPDVNILGRYTDASAGREQIIDHRPDMVFLDVDMTSMCGFDLISSLPSVNFALIILSAFDQLAPKAFEFNAADYLLKPIKRNRLRRAVLRANTLHKTKVNDQLPLYIASNSSPFNYRSSSIPIPTQHGYDFVKANRIIYAEADGNYSRIHFNDGSEKYLSITLKKLESMLRRHPFIRIHQSFLINLDHIQKYFKGNGGYVVMSNGKDLSVSRRSKDKIMGMIRNMHGYEVHRTG